MYIFQLYIHSIRKKYALHEAGHMIFSNQKAGNIGISVGPVNADADG